MSSIPTGNGITTAEVEARLTALGEARREVGRRMRKPTGREQRAEELITKYAADLVPDIEDDSQAFWHAVEDLCAVLSQTEYEAMTLWVAQRRAGL